MTTTIDTERNITFDFEDKNFPNVHLFHYLPDGLHLLARSVRELENNNFSSKMPKPVFKLDLDDPHLGILTCHFHWFANSLVNYLRFVGLIELLNEKNWTFKDVSAHKNIVKDHCGSYVLSVIPDILHWRNKVSAHFSVTDPRNDDNIADFTYSVMHQVSFMIPHYETGRINFGTDGFTTDFKPWSLTKTFEDLASRYWTDKILEPIR